ncbi:MAG TPA: hypothetical protein IGS53_05495 [Leptolyngbyaceae cyanobacterium M33_DOE_097]|nr:hypothetical protein [Leptolyngbyaceae cyanobacterium M33_DOE_097]
MAALDPQQVDRLMAHIEGLENLLTEVDEQGADEILDELYLLITKLFEQFPQLDQDED